jgi:hypothetical protein
MPHLCTVTSAAEGFDPSSSLDFGVGVCLPFWQGRAGFASSSTRGSVVASVAWQRQQRLPSLLPRPDRALPKARRHCEFSCLRVGNGVNLDIAVLPSCHYLSWPQQAAGQHPLPTLPEHMFSRQSSSAVRCAEAAEPTGGGGIPSPPGTGTTTLLPPSPLLLSICLAVGDDDNLPGAGMFHARRPGERGHLSGELP